MLVLTRKEDEYFMIGDSIKVMITTCAGTVKLGISAPKDVKILRGELCDAEEQDDTEE